MSNLTGRPPYTKSKPVLVVRRNQPTALDKRYWKHVITVGCILANAVSEAGFECEGRITIHHCGTGGGGRKNHKLVLPLCWEHHVGGRGIDGQQMSKREWQTKYGSEEKLLKRLERLLQSSSMRGISL